MPGSAPHSGFRWLRAGDQLAAGLAIALALAVIGMHHWWRGGLEGQLIEIEATAPQPVLFQIDINTASQSEFLVLPEVGEALAQRIVADRQANGPFRSHDDLRRVRGIGPKTLERIRPYLLPMAEEGAFAAQ